MRARDRVYRLAHRAYAPTGPETRVTAPTGEHKVLRLYKLFLMERVMDDKPNHDGKMSEEERRYRVENRLRLREEPLTKQERRDAIKMIFERDRELFQILADA